MKYKVVIELVAESNLEEHFIHDELPGAVWIPNPGCTTVFYLPESEEDRVTEVMKKWKETYET